MRVVNPVSTVVKCLMNSSGSRIEPCTILIQIKNFSFDGSWSQDAITSLTD